MKDTNCDLCQEVALFRYGLIADLVHLAPGTPGLYRRLEEKAAGDYRIPGSTRTRVAAETLRDWLKRYGQGGFAALLPETTRRPRSLPWAACGSRRPAIVDQGRQPELSVRLVIQTARATGQVPDELPLPPSTVHRLLLRQAA